MKKRFIFDENYIKKYAKKDKIKWLVIIISILVLILVFVIVKIASTNKKPVIDTPTYKVKEELVVESGSKIPSVKDYFDNLKDIDVKDIEVSYIDPLETSYDVSLCSEEEQTMINDILATCSGDDCFETIPECAAQNLKTPATYKVLVKILNEEHNVNLIVKDTEAPTVVTKTVEIYKGEQYKIEDFVDSCYDVTSECNISFYSEDKDEEGKAIDYSKFSEPGEYTVKLVSKDNYDNISDPIEATLIIKEAEATLYTVTFNSDGGSSVESISVLDGETITEPKAPTKDGYTFEGWFNGNNKFDFTTPIKNNLTLTAKWNKKDNSGGNTTSPTVNVSSISLSKSKISLTVGNSTTVKATVKPSNATNKTVSWSSSNTSIATVKNGKITAKKAGTATITAKAGGKSAKVTVTVKAKTTTNNCPYGNNKYDSSKYILSVNLSKNGCAINPNSSPNSYADSNEQTRLMNDLKSLGYKVSGNSFSFNSSTIKVKNTAGTGLVGYQITIYVEVLDKNNSHLIRKATYILNSNGTRKFSLNQISGLK